MNTKYLAQYFNNGKWKTISCYRYKKLCSQEPTRWEKINLKSKPIQGKRYDVHVRSNSTKFCFNPSSSPSNISPNRMTTTHEFITEVIANLKVLNLKIGKDYKCEIIPDITFHEQERLKVYCTEKKEIFEYIPDLLVRFSNNQKLVRYWGGQIAIEVNVTHKPGDTKRKHFQYMGIPLLEIDASKDLMFKYEGQDIEEEKLIKYKAELKRKLSVEIETTIAYRTYSNRELGHQNFWLLKDKKELDENNDSLILENNKLLNNKRELEINYENSKEEFLGLLAKMKNINLSLKEELDNLKNRTLFKILVDFFIRKTE